MSKKVRVHVETEYISEQSSTEEKRFVFMYTINIENMGGDSVKLLARHWVITDSNGRVETVDGEGVVGDQPIIPANETYTYNSGAILDTDVGTISGYYTMMDSGGEHFDVSVDKFVLSVPRTLH